VTRPGPSQRIRVVQHDHERINGREDRLATEEPLEIRLGWPGHLGGSHELRTVAYCTDVELSEDERYNVVTVTWCAQAPSILPAEVGDSLFMQVTSASAPPTDSPSTCRWS
jgi:FdhD protein